MKADPDWNHDSRVVEPVYIVPGKRRFKERTATSGPYAPDDEEE